MAGATRVDKDDVLVKATGYFDELKSQSASAVFLFAGGGLVASRCYVALALPAC